MIWGSSIDTGKENRAIDWTFPVGDRVKIRLVNTMDSDHPMHHPFHIHGAGRFLVIARDGRRAEPRVEGHRARPRRRDRRHRARRHEPGLWMAHCHIAEHNQSGMMFSFPVPAPRPGVDEVAVEPDAMTGR